MKLIKKLDSRRDESGGMKIWGLFHCSYCNKEVEKRYHHGLKQKSCGCAKSKLTGEANVKHGCARRGHENRLYRIWGNMKSRCYSPTSSRYKYYGDRGISICEQWKNDITVFKTWALTHGYRENLTIDRINNNGNYSPSNCRWATVTEQNRKLRNTKLTMKKANKIRGFYPKLKLKLNQKDFLILFSSIYGTSKSCILSVINDTSWM